MFENDKLKKHLQESSVIKSESAIIAEWNMNISDNIFKVGNYRYRPEDTTIPKYSSLTNSFDEYDEGYFYTNATDADIVIDGGISDDDVPVLFKSAKSKEALLYSLEDCFYRFRPRSGINKLRYFSNNFTHYANPEMSQRPRYYMASRDDKFKYWTSYRTEAVYKYKYPFNSIGEDTYIYGAKPTYLDETETERSGELLYSKERGIALEELGATGSYKIDDAAPYIVYKDSVPANRIIIKMQTNTGTVNLGPFSNSTENFEDPFYGSNNQTTPVKWKIQYLEEDSWLDAISFNSNSIRSDGTAIIKSDGYVEISYGLVLPEEYKNIFVKKSELSSVDLLPDIAQVGDAFLVKENSIDLGTYHIYTGIDFGYQSFIPKYGWYLSEENVTSQTSYATDLVSPEKYFDTSAKKYYYPEFKEILGLRLVVDSMNKLDSTFDLIELSPRLSVDMADRTLSFSLDKIASDLGVSGLPVSQLLASVGTISIFDYDQAFNQNNSWNSLTGTGSIISNYITKNIQFKFYEVIKDVLEEVDASGNSIFYNYYIPIKTMYADGFPSIDSTNREVSMELRDMYFYFESATAPELLIQNVSLSSAIATLLDSIGFSNYSFKRVENKEDLVIPYFSVAPETSVAQVLNDLAISTQSSMFFDEYNNFIVMSKDYMMPTTEQRLTDLKLYGSKDFYDSGVLENKLGTSSTSTQTELSNILAISSQENSVYNDGVINYTQRSIARTYGSLQQVSLLSQDQTWIYEPSLLWEVAGEENLTSINNRTGNQSNYLLSAMPLNTTLTNKLPRVENFKIINNTMSFGESIYSTFRYNGYFYSNGEIIRYDAVQYSIPGLSDTELDNPNVEGNNVWVTSLKEYQDYFSKIPFNGKMYPTGLIRIYTEANYEEILDIVTGESTTRIKNGPVAKHGRAQFGTEIANHSAGLDSYWFDNANVRGCDMNSKLLFSVIPATYDYDTFTTVDNKTFTVSSVTSIVVGATVKLVEIFGSVVSTVGYRSSTIQSIDTVNKTFTTVDTMNVQAGDSLEVQNLIKTVANTAAGISNEIAKQGTRNGIIKNYLSNVYKTEAEVNSLYSTEPGTIQSSAFILNGPPATTSYDPIDFVSYVYKPLENNFKHFGTRLRIIGRSENSDIRNQTALGSFTYYSSQSSDPGAEVSITGASGGLGVMINPLTNNGYYYEIIALNQNSSSNFDNTSSTHNIVFYKVEKDEFSTRAIPIKLWGTFSDQIITDYGDLTGQYRLTGDENSSVYDLAVEYEKIGNSLRFYLYLDGKIVGVVDDENPLNIHNNMALFSRGSSRCMFENIYAITSSYSENSNAAITTPANSVFDNEQITTGEAFSKYSMSGIVKDSYLSGISAQGSPAFNMYFEEFGTIMREAAYFNVKYDKAFPALYAKLSPTFNKIRGYTTSGFFAGAYGAEFLIFNSTDTNLSLDSASGNYLKIQGITFTQESEAEFSVDDYFSIRTDFSKPQLVDKTRVVSPSIAQKEYFEIKNSRTTYGRNEFSLNAPYIQNQDDAKDLMSWMIGKIMKPRKSIGVDIFPMPTLQLGDIVEISYKDTSGVNVVSDEKSRFVVYNINYSRSTAGPEMKIFLSEVK